MKKYGKTKKISRSWGNKNFSHLYFSPPVFWSLKIFFSFKTWLTGKLTIFVFSAGCGKINHIWVKRIFIFSFIIRLDFFSLVSFVLFFLWFVFHTVHTVHTAGHIKRWNIWFIDYNFFLCTWQSNINSPPPRIESF